MLDNEEKVENQNEEQPEEKIVEEPQVSEETKEETRNFEVVQKLDNDEAYDVTIENLRKDLFAAYSQSRKVSNILTVAVLVVAVVAMIMITQKDSALSVIGWILSGITVLGLIIYYALTKNKFPDKTREYIKEITKILNGYAFKDDKFTDLLTDPNEKINLEDLIGDDVYNSVGNVGSRNVVRGKYNKNSFMYGEIALQIQGATKKDAPLFVGKYVSITNNLKMKGRIIINLKKKENACDMPNKTGDLAVLSSTDDMVIYGLKDTDYEKVLGSKFFKEIKTLAPVDHLLNTNIVIWGGKTGFYLSYDDSVMILPFEKAFDGKANQQLVDNMLDSIKANEALGTK